MTRILVTGCAGFIGSNLCRVLLDEGYDVHGIDDLSAGLASQVPTGVEWARVDICDPRCAEHFAGADVVFHLAARNCLLDCMHHPVETADVNVRGTVQVLEACRAAGVGKVVFAETSAVYEGVAELPSREEVVRPVGIYASSKHAAAQFVRSYADTFGLRFTILRYFNVYGPAQDLRRRIAPVMGAFARALLAGEPPVIYGTGRKRRDFIHVDDVNRFHVRCVWDRRTDGRVFNLGSGQNHSVLDIYEATAELLGTTIRPRFEPDLPCEAQDTLADIERARSLGWAPRIDLKQGLSHTITSMRTAPTPLETTS